MTKTTREVIDFVSEIRNPKPGPTRSVASLRTMLRGALGKFEETLSALPPKQRTIAEGIYLEKIRTLTFHFHLALQTEVATQKTKGATSPRQLEHLLAESEAASLEIARLYGFH